MYYLVYGAKSKEEKYFKTANWVQQTSNVTALNWIAWNWLRWKILRRILLSRQSQIGHSSEQWEGHRSNCWIAQVIQNHEIVWNSFVFPIVTRSINWISNQFEKFHLRGYVCNISAKIYNQSSDEVENDLIQCLILLD